MIQSSSSYYNYYEISNVIKFSKIQLKNLFEYNLQSNSLFRAIQRNDKTFVISSSLYHKHFVPTHVAHVKTLWSVLVSANGLCHVLRYSCETISRGTDASTVCEEYKKSKNPFSRRGLRTKLKSRQTLIFFK